MEAVVVAKEGRVGACIDICLEMSSGIQTPTEAPATERRSSEKSQAGEGMTGRERDLLGLEGENGFGNLSLGDDGRERGHQQPVDLMR